MQCLRLLSVDLAIAYFFYGLTFSFPQSSLDLFINDNLRMSEAPEGVNIYYTTIFAIFSLKFMWAAFCDLLPLWKGQRRKPYILIGSTVVFIGYLLLGNVVGTIFGLYAVGIFIAIGEGLVSYALNGLISERLYADVTDDGEGDAPKNADFSSMSAAQQQQVTRTATHSQIVVRTAQQISTLIATLLSTLFLYGVPDPTWGFTVAAILPALLFLVSWLLIKETPVYFVNNEQLVYSRYPRCQKVWEYIRAFIRGLMELWECAALPLLYFFIRSALPESSSAVTSWIINTGDSTAWFFSSLSFFDPLGGQAAILFYWFVFRNVSIKFAIIWTFFCELLSAAFKVAMVTRFNRLIGIPDLAVLIFERFVFGFHTRLCYMPVVVLATLIRPKQDYNDEEALDEYEHKRHLEKKGGTKGGTKGGGGDDENFETYVDSESIIVRQSLSSTKSVRTNSNSNRSEGFEIEMTHEIDKSIVEEKPAYKRSDSPIPIYRSRRLAASAAFLFATFMAMGSFGGMISGPLSSGSTKILNVGPENNWSTLWILCLLCAIGKCLPLIFIVLWKGKIEARQPELSIRPSH